MSTMNNWSIFISSKVIAIQKCLKLLKAVEKLTMITHLLIYVQLEGCFFFFFFHEKIDNYDLKNDTNLTQFEFKTSEIYLFIVRATMLSTCHRVYMHLLRVHKKIEKPTIHINNLISLLGLS